MIKIVVVILILLAVAIGYYVLQNGVPENIPVDTLSTKISRDQALEKVKKLPEVQQYLKNVPNGKVEVDNELEGEYNVHVYEVKNGHTATFNWYHVSIKSGEVQEQLSVTKGIVSGKLCYPSEVVPEGIIEAKRISDGKIFILNHNDSSDKGGLNYKFKLEEGDYYLRFKTKANIIGYSTTVCPTGKEETCGDTKPRILVKANVKANQEISNYNLCDYYYKDSSAQSFN